MRSPNAKSKHLLAIALSFLSCSNFSLASTLDEAFPEYISEESTTNLIEISTPPNVSVNESYCYTVYDINSFLIHRYKSIPWISVVPGVPYIPDIELSAEIRQRLEKESADKGEKSRIILMPYVNKNLDIFAISIIKDKVGTRGVVIPSINCAEIPTDLIAILQSVYGGSVTFSMLQGYYCLENRPEDYGVITLENLSAFGTSGGVSIFPVVSTIVFRHQHIQESKSTIMGTPIWPTEGFYEFPERQACNLPVIPYLLPNNRLSWAQVRPFELTVSYEDRAKIKRAIQKLSSSYDPRGEFSKLFEDIDGSSEAPINFGLQLRYKQIPWHLLSLHTWESFSELSTGLNNVIIKELAHASSADMTGFQSIKGMLKKVVELETLTEDDLYGINLLKSFWQYRYIQDALKDLDKRIKTIGSEKLDTKERRLGTLRLLQVAGEYFSKLKHIPVFKTLLKILYLEEFRNIFSHLEDLQHTIQCILDDTSLYWSEIYGEVHSLGLTLQKLQSDIKMPPSLTDLGEQWNFIKNLVKSIQEIKVNFPGVASLRKQLSIANPSTKKEKSSVSNDEANKLCLSLSSDATQRAAIQKVLSDKKIDRSDSRRIHEYVEFIRTLHERGIAFDREGFWEDKTTYPELLFHQMRGKTADFIATPASKRSYRIELLTSAIKLLEWGRKLLGVEGIDLLSELASSEIISDEAKKDLPKTIINTEIHFNKTPTCITDKRLQEFLEKNPSGLFVIEFLIGAAYEALRPIFYFPEFKEHYLRNMRVRNYYDHPDPTYLTPFIIWEAQELTRWDGRSIHTRPDRDDGFQKVLLQEASRLLVPLYHVLLEIRKQMRDLPGETLGNGK